LLPAALGGLTCLLHLLTAGDSYGVFRDELYYLACGEHLGFGYVDHPPLIGLIAWLGRGVFGDSLTGLRVLPALAAGATVFVTAMMARELGGGRTAQALAGAATALAPVYVGNFGILSMNAFDVLLWSAAAWIVMRLLRSGDARLWPWFGLVAGIGLLNKISMLFLGFGLVVGLLLARRFDVFREPRLWLGGAIAFVLFLPHLVWQAVQGWPTLEFMENATRDKNLPLAPWEFLSAQVWMMNPIVVPLALAGLGFYLFGRAGRPWRPLGWAFLVVVVLMITQRSKAYYLSPSYTLLFAAGAVLVGSLATRRALGWVRPVALALVVVTGLGLAPLAKPVLPVETYVAYAARLGVAPSTSERKSLGRLPQFFADRLGWRELAESVRQIVRSLPPEEQAEACVYGQNYGQAGAIDFYRDELDLPPALSGHNSYHLWGPGDCSGKVLIVIDGDRDDLLEIFESVELATTYRCDDCMPYENGKPIWICRNMRLPVETLWPRLRHFG
jgi:4-amino-4-deoxy-L-arabinose transferase-like glycosyltransferase